jgi:hypothetical protein
VTDEKWWVDLIDPRHVVAPSGFIARTAPEHAALIAAAPELLAALEAVVRVADRKTDEFDMAHAAIAKARGDAA